MYIISIDVGVINFGVVGAYIKENYTIDYIDFCDVINIKDISLHCTDSNCNLHHDLCIADYMAHLFKKLKDYFQKAHTILIERQPPQGIIAVQELIVYKYRDRTKMVSPNSMHCHFGIRDYTYEKRKIHTVNLSKHLLNKFERFNKEPHRSEHMADALCLLKFYIYGKSIIYTQQQIKLKWQNTHRKFITTMENFKYVEDFKYVDTLPWKKKIPQTESSTEKL